ncbi:hypothetical protein [Phytohabitans rumicis]|uniref:hypothetical protein n=1 Tax=Phytohabitans rumicis TaxID=1076125 RepID=UPI00156479F5|nr:hypothetical protein [Phytohabitans rumicis]
MILKWAFALLLLLSSCSSPAPSIAWQEVTLPSAEAAVRDLAFCDNHWYAVGGLPTGPAAWTSNDGQTWTGVRLTPVSFYGKQSTIFTVACRGTDVIAVGAASGGAHGNPRTSTWRSRPDGSWLEYEPEFEQFGGQESVGVGAAAAGPAAGLTGWAIAGNWLGPDGSPGPALWRSTDGISFTRVLVAPASSARGTDVAFAAGRWIVVGEAYGATLSGASWTSVDGTRWTSVPVESPLALVTPDGDGALAVGAGGAWWYDGAGWQRRGGLAADARFLSLTAGDGLAVTTGGSTECRLWSTRDGGTTWRELTMPAPLPMTAETAASVAVGAGHVVLATDDGHRSHLWLTTAAPSSPLLRARSRPARAPLAPSIKGIWSWLDLFSTTVCP